MAMTPTQQAGSTTRYPVVPHVDRSPAACGCGQDLDLCAGRHCPRCGTQLGAFRPEPAGFWKAA